MRIIQTLAAGLLLACTTQLSAQPAAPGIKGPVSLLVPYPAGGASDITARIFAEPLSRELGVPVVVENIGGATGAIAAQKMLNAPADGRILYQGSQNELILPPLTVPGTRYSPADFEIVQPITTTRLVLVARKGLPVKTLDEFVALIRARGQADPITCGIPGVGSLYHLIPADMARHAGAQLNFIPYKGTAPIVQDILGDRIDFTIMAYSTTMLQYVQEGRYRIIANLSKDKPKELADLPSLSEHPLFKEMDYASRAAYYVRKGTPANVRQALNAAIGKVVESPAVIQGLEGDGRRVLKHMPVAQAEGFYRDEVETYRKMVETTGFKPAQ
ncbi:Bug family tripartite tricarboxylate transporter substrate binding protein [Bordetella genomosp. 13]|uniref:Bug family tripartite tricarboxylate transporter substrate binding protein n=1 Tax=Bordetella genomosp. 13 TaxID=463040 RepID=UPI0016423672|nr:tripartite tricarboxylate transporter substrate binding protein [Bordetella genomosp. 13]